MPMFTYPDYVYKTLARVHDEGEWYAAQSIAVGYCFDVLTLIPDCEEAKELIYELFCSGVRRKCRQVPRGERVNPSQSEGFWNISAQGEIALLLRIFF